MPQLLWSKHQCNNALTSDRVAFLELKEVSEVFVTLRIGLRRAKECGDSLHLALLDTNALEWNSDHDESPLDDADHESATTATESRHADDNDSDNDEDEGEGDDAGASTTPDDSVEVESSHVEYLLAVEQVEIIEGVRTVIGKRREVYYCTKKPVIQLIDLTAASRFDVSVGANHVHHSTKTFV